jgi:hypothetical protein
MGKMHLSKSLSLILTNFPSFKNVRARECEHAKKREKKLSLKQTHKQKDGHEFDGKEETQKRRKERRRET